MSAPFALKHGSVRGAISVFAPLFIIIGFATLLLLPQVAYAQEPVAPPVMEQEYTKPCSSCHAEESEAWLDSPHASLADPDTGLALATCTSCHGDYSRGHPDEEMAPLKVDSSSCQECHVDTWSQWENSLHGGEGVQCISCHLPHSQEMRLTDEGMCTSCHKESLDDSLHLAHWETETACTDCHMAGGTDHAQLASAGDGLTALTALTALAPSHDFVTVSASKCLDCHREDVSAGPAGISSQTIALNELSSKLPEVEAQLTKAQQTNRSLGFLSVANLGFGLGIGGILGIVFMVVYARWFSNQNREGQP